MVQIAGCAQVRQGRSSQPQADNFGLGMIIIGKNCNNIRPDGRDFEIYYTFYYLSAQMTD